MQIKVILLVIMLTVSVVFTNGIITSTSKTPEKRETNNQSVIVRGMNELELRAEFDRISKLPYEQYKCRQKSDMLWEFIHNHDPYSKVYTISVTHISGKYSHVFVEYEGVIFDTTCNPPLYRQSWDKYDKNLEIWGFNKKQMICQG